MKYITLAMLIGLLFIYLFWFLPSMRSTYAYQEAMDRVLSECEDCVERSGYQCFDKWHTWLRKNHQPESGINWPWYVWRESQGPQETK